MLLTPILLVPLAAALLCLLARSRRVMEALNVAAFATALALGLRLVPQVLARGVVSEWREFLYADALSAWMVLLISTVSLATSTDQGKSWTCHGEIINSSNPTDPKYWEGKNYWDEARGDPSLIVDGKYFYVYYNARWVSREDVPADVIEAELDIYRAQAADKPGAKI